MKSTLFNRKVTRKVLQQGNQSGFDEGFVGLHLRDFIKLGEIFTIQMREDGCVLSGSVRKENKGWYYVIELGTDAHGKRKQKKKRGFKTKKEAQMALSLALSEIHQGTYIEPKKLLYKDFLIQWLDTKKNSLKEQTHQIYSVIIHSRIIPKLGSFHVQQLTVPIIQQFINDQSKQKLSGAYIRKMINILNGSLTNAVKLGIIKNNPVGLVEKPRVPKKEVNVWDVSEIRRFLSTAQDHHLYIAFLLAITTGLRQGEILGLRWKDIDFVQETLSIKQTLSHDGKHLVAGAKSTSSLRVVGLPQDTIKALLTHRDKQMQLEIPNTHDLVVCSSNGTPIDPRNLTRAFKILQRKADVSDIRFHDLRHTHATLLLKQGTHIKVVAERLGHSDTKLTLDTYSHVLPTMQAEATKAIQNILFEKEADQSM